MAGIYIHVPFCKSKCIYCDFYSNVNLGKRESYVNSVLKEIELRKSLWMPEKLDTIYFGGGTPSLLSPKQLSEIIRSLRSCYSSFNPKESTIEVNPDDINEDYVKALIDIGFNRISIGVESFDDDQLKFLGRTHSSSKAKKAVEQCQKNGFSNISIDLMYGLPGQSLSSWEKSIDAAMDMGITHLSSYHLIYEEKTPLFTMVKRKKLFPVEESLSLDMFELLVDRVAESGFMHYEISSFAKGEDNISKHNFSYWNGDHFLGLGPSAHSYDGVSRFWNYSSVSKYETSLSEGILPCETEVLSEKDNYNDVVLTGLRTRYGIDLSEMKKRFGDHRLNYLLTQSDRYLRQQILVLNGDRLTLSRKGIFISDAVMSDLMMLD